MCVTTWLAILARGQVELVSTACYGVRVYTNTSWLANHVDTRSTHAVSVIMQIDQVTTVMEPNAQIEPQYVAISVLNYLC